MSHSNQIREYHFSPQGLELLDVYVGAGGVLTGSARQAQEARERTKELQRQQEQGRRQAEAQAEQMALEAQIAALQAKLTAQAHKLQAMAAQEQAFQTQQQVDRAAMARVRQADAPDVPRRDGTLRRRGGRK